MGAYITTGDTEFDEWINPLLDEIVGPMPTPDEKAWEDLCAETAAWARAHPEYDI